MNIKEIIEASGKSLDNLVTEIGGIRRAHLQGAINGVVHPNILKKITDRLEQLGYGVVEEGEPEEVTEPDATPVAKQMMDNHDIDPACVSSASGRITVADVKRYIKNMD
jgi:hypothetical protein